MTRRITALAKVFGLLLAGAVTLALIVYLHLEHGAFQALRGPVETVRALVPNAGPADEPASTQAERFGADDQGRLSYSELERALASPDSRAVELGDLGGARILFRDSSRAESGFPPEELSALAQRLDREGKEVTVVSGLAAPDGRDGDIISRLPLFPHRILLILAGAGLVLLIISLIARLAEKRKTGQKSQEMARSQRPEVSFSDVAGCDEALEEISEFAEFIRDQERFQRVGARIPSGAILHGPPGTGKTLIAKALAGEAQVPFYYLSGSEAVNRYVGVGAKTVRDLFQRARGNEAGAVIFIDEIDAIGRARSGSEDQASREYDQTLNQLLVEMDGFRNSDRVVVIGATNRLDVLDAALLRPGRLSRHIPVLPPAEEGRRAILELYTASKPLADDVDLDALARITSGSTGADLADMVNEAAIQAARDGRREISDADLREGHLRALAGPKRASSNMRPEELRQVAYHEAGHVLCAEVSPDHEKAQRVTIVSRGQAAGLAVYGREDRALHSPDYVRQQLVAILGGRAAERVAFGTVSSGAANDLQQANELARRAIEEWGLSQLTGQLVSRGGGQVSDQTRSLVDQEVEAMVAEAFSGAVAILEEHRSQLESLAEALLEQKTLERVDILAAIGPDSRIDHRPADPGPSLRPVINPRVGVTRTDAPKRRTRPALAHALSRIRHLRRAKIKSE
jgi:cell division protease FtsH